MIVRANTEQHWLNTSNQGCRITLAWKPSLFFLVIHWNRVRVKQNATKLYKPLILSWFIQLQLMQLNSILNTHRLRNDLYCVGWGVKLCSLTHTEYTKNGRFKMWQISYYKSTVRASSDFSCTFTVCEHALSRLAAERVPWLLELLIPGKFISREGNKFPGTRSGLDRVSILSAANR